jgi:hypothetical protein
MARVEGFEPAHSGQQAPEQPPGVGRTRLDQQWREVEALVQRIRENAPWQQPG